MDLINKRALANYIKKNIRHDVSIDAVISALRRYPTEEIKLSEGTISDVLNDSKISTKTKIVSIATHRDPKVLTKLLPNVFSAIDASKGEVIRLVEGRESLKILVDKKKLQDILEILPKGEADVEDTVLTEINIHFSKGYNKVIGLRASILNELAINDIDVVEVISCLPEFMVFVNERDTAKAHEILLRFLYREDA